MPKILAIDDKMDNLISVSALLKSMIPDCEVITALSGADGIAKAKSEAPDVILLDIKMPVMDGFEVCKRMKADEATKHIPIAMLTAVHTDTDSLTRALDLGADAFFSKPIDGVELSAQVKALLRIKDAEDALRYERDNLDDLVKERTRALQESEARFRSMFENHDAVMLILDGESGQIIEANQSAIDFYGYSHVEFTNLNIEDINCLSKEQIAIERTKATELKQNYFEFPHKLKNGEIHIVEVHSSPIKFEDQTVLFSIIHDITERKRAEEMLAENDLKYRSLFDNKLNGLAYCKIVVDENNRPVDYIFLEINRAFEEFTGLKKEVVLGKRITEVIPGFEKSAFDFIGIHGKVALTGEEVRFEQYQEQLKRWYSVYLYSPKKEYFVSIFSEITAQKLAEEALRRNEEKLNQIINSSPVGICTVDMLGNFITTNPEYERMVGYAKEELVGLSFYDVTHPNDRPKNKKLFQDMFSLETTDFSMEKRYIRKDGEEIKVSVHAIGIRDAEGNVRFGTAFVEDITERKQAENTLRDTNARHSAMIENIGDVIAIMGADGMTKYQSPNIEKWFGWKPEDLIGTSGWDWMHPEDIERVQKEFSKMLEKETPSTVEYRFKCKDGNYKWIELTAVNRIKEPEINGLLLNYHDITERKQALDERRNLEIHMRQQQKLESIGTLASGIAHEINNPINGIMNYAQLIDDRLDEENPLKEYTKEIAVETERVSTIVRNLLTFSRAEKETHSPANIQDIVNDTNSLVQAIIKHDQITLELDIPDDLPQIRCRSQQIQQVLMNLLTNARDALNERYPDYDENKLLTIKVRPFERDEIDWIRLTVEDHGIGIPEEIQDRIFDPFFTTKDRATGTGLGLSISYGIIKDHHGEMHVESETGQYTRFHVDLKVNSDWTLDTGDEKNE
ncbi:MAG: PAS domain S-box protein [Candidatus Electryonea clarkiae]|nr:PAS domain S-box protein [Candidatus Electryonea clarkiae]